MKESQEDDLTNEFFEEYAKKAAYAAKEEDTEEKSWTTESG